MPSLVGALSAQFTFFMPNLTTVRISFLRPRWPILVVSVLNSGRVCMREYRSDRPLFVCVHRSAGIILPAKSNGLLSRENEGGSLLPSELGIRTTTSSGQDSDLIPACSGLHV